MKKIQGLAILIFLLCSSFSGLPHFIMNFGPENGKTNIYFVVNPPKDSQTLFKLYQGLGKPAFDNAGKIEWNNVSIEGVGTGLTILVTDGLHTSDLAAHTGCFVPFKSKADQQSLLQNIKENQRRYMQIQIKNSKGEDFLKDGVVEFKLENFLNQKMQ